MWWESRALHPSSPLWWRQSLIHPGTWRCFWFTVFLGRGSFSGFHLAFSMIIALTLQAREAVRGSCQLLGMSAPISHSGTVEITTGWVHGPIGPTVRWT